MAEKERVAALVKQMNQTNKKSASKPQKRQTDKRKSQKSDTKTKGKTAVPVRFPGI